MKLHHMNRIKYLDIARGIAIVTVVFYHTRYLPFQNFLLPLITPWMLPIFAVVGGLLYRHRETESFWAFFKRKFRTLMIPYIAFGVLSLVLWLIIRNVYDGRYIWAPVSSQIAGLTLGKELIFNGPLWFLPCYFLTGIFIRALYPYLGKSIKAQTLVILLLIISFLSPQGKMPYALNLIPLFSFFYLLGILLRQHIEDLRRSWELFALSVVLFIPLALSNGIIDVYGTVFHNYLAYIISAALGAYIILFKATLVEKFYGARLVNFFSYLGKNSMTVFAVHVPIMQWTTVLVSRTPIFTYTHGVPNLSSFDIFLSNGRLFFLFGLLLFIIYSFAALLGSYLIVRLSQRLKLGKV